MSRSDKSWGWNMRQKIEAMCLDLDGFVCKEPGLYIGNQMQTVGESVKKLYSDVMQDLLSPLADPAQFLPAKCVDLAETSKTSVVTAVKDSVDETDKSKEAPVVPETCYKTSTSSGVNHAEQMTEDGNLINNTSDNTIQFPCEDEKADDDHSASENHLDDMSQHEDIICDASSQNDDTESEIGSIDLNLSTDEKKMEVEPLMNLKEKCYEEPSAKISCESSESHLDDMSKNEDTISQCDDSEFEDCWSLAEILDDMSDPEDITCNASAQSDDSVCEDGWGEALSIELNLDTEETNEVEPLINLNEKCDDDCSVKMSLESSQNRVDERIKLEGLLCYASLQSDASECEGGRGETDIIKLDLGTEEKIEVDPLSNTTAFEDAGWDIPNMIDRYLIPEEKIKVEPFMNLNEKCDDDHSAKMSCDISENHFEDVFKQEGMLSYSSSESDALEFEDEGVKNVIEMNLGEFSENHFEDIIKQEGILSDASTKSDASEFEDEGIENVIDMNLGEFLENHFENIIKQEEILSDASSQSDATEFEDEGIKNVIDMNLGEFSENHFEDITKQEGILSDASSQSDASKFEDEGMNNVIDMNLGELSENHFEDIIKQEGILSDASSQTDVSEFEDEGIENVIDMNLGPEEKIEVEPLMNLKEKCDDEHSAKTSCEFSENHFEDILRQAGLISNASSQCDASEFEDEGIKNVIDMNLGPEEKIEMEPLLNDALAFEDVDCGITNIIDLNLDTEDKEVEPLMNLEEKKTLMNCSITEFDCDSSTHQASELENSVNYNENKENGSQTSVGDFSVSSFGLSSCGSNNISTSFTFSSHYAVSNDGSASAYSEDVKLGTIAMPNGKKLDESSVIAEGGKSTDFPVKAGKSKSYKKMIQDVFMSRKRLAKEYKQLAVLYGGIDNESTEGNKLPNIDTSDLLNSEWELL